MLEHIPGLAWYACVRSLSLSSPRLSPPTFSRGFLFEALGLELLWIWCSACSSATCYSRRGCQSLLYCSHTELETRVGDGNNVANSLLMSCPKLGVNVKVATPPGRYEIKVKQRLVVEIL